MKITEYKNEDALELLADILEPVTIIFSDEKVLEEAEHGNDMKLIKYILKNHNKQVVEILARMDGVEPSEYNGSIPKMISQLMEIVSDKELMSFFIAPEQKSLASSFGSATENTKENGV